MDLKIRSEIDPLRLVITHKPGNEHEFITPENLVEKIQTNNQILSIPLQ